MPIASGPTPTRQQLMTLLRGFMLQILPDGTEVVIGQANRVPQPTNDNMVTMVVSGLKRLATTVVTWTAVTDPPPTTAGYQQDVGVKVQLQVFGELSPDNVNTITTLLRSPYGVDFFAGSGIAPLYCDDGQQIPFITGETQYQDRWIVEAMFEMSVEMAAAQQFATGASITGVYNVDVEFPPT